ncbi:MAG TPA: M20/M25/M40 family metallo-hydrolase [Vicinamibacterales bacterium]|nr:M20/M25/M40 family metallo-hydrolase [Vicinamibacterales bacterium]
MSKTVLAVLTGLAIAAAPAFQSEKIDAEINAKIRAEAMNNSQIMRTMHYLTDVYGPRLTGSPNFNAAAEWTVKQMTDWGFKNGRLEPWDFVNADGTPRPGWLNERFAGHIVAPVKDSLVGEVLAWTPSTKGTVTQDAVNIVPPARPTQAELDAWIQEVTPRIRGKIVLVGAHRTVPVNLNPAPLRRDDEALRRQLDPNAPPDEGRGRGGRGRGGEPEAPDPTRLTAQAVNAAVNDLMLAANVAVRVNDAGMDHGLIRAFQNNTYDVTKAPPTVILRNEDYGRITRLLASGMPVRLEFTVVNRTFPPGKSYNAIAEIPGTDKADEVVMLGGHLDSWHAATGATDNAIGCAVMMEAARILQAIGVKPRRTIRVALWGGEEQGLLGSRAYVKEHFGTAEEPKPAFHKFNGYFNVDSGTGRIRSATVFGPPEAAAVLRDIFKPFEDFGVLGAMATSGRRAGGTDSASFMEAGLPGIGLSQDPIQYQSYTWHTNLDTYERIIEDDVKKSAAAIASAVYHLAMRDEMLPRFPKDKMPALPPPPGQGRGVNVER